MAAGSLPSFLASLDIQNARSSKDYIGTRLANPAMQMEEMVPSWIRTSSLEDIREAFSLLIEKVCHREFPARFTPQFWLAHTALQSVYNVLSAYRHDNMGSLDVVFEINQLLFSLWVRLMEAGPGSSHLEMIDIILKHETDPLWKYMMTLKGDDLKLLLSSLKTDFVYEEEISSVHYATLMETHVDKVFKRILTAEQYEEAHMGMLDLYGYYLTRMNHVPPHIGPRLSHLCFLISKSYKLENPYLDLQDWVLLRHHLRLVKQVITDTTFTRASEAQYRAPITLEKIFQAAIADDMLETMFKDFMSLLSVMCNYSNSRNCARLFCAYKEGLFDRLELDKLKEPPPMWLFHQCMVPMTTVASANGITAPMEDLLIAAQELCLLKYTELSLKEVIMWQKLLVNYVVSGRRTLVTQATQLLQNPNLYDNKVFAWKSNVSDVKTLIDIVADLPQTFIQDDDVASSDDTVKSYVEFLLVLLNQVSALDLQSSVRENLQRCVLKCVEKDPPTKAVIAWEILQLELLEFKDKNFVRDVLWTTGKVLADPDFTWIDEVLTKVVESLMSSCIEKFQTSGYIPAEFSEMLINLAVTCLERDVYAYSMAGLTEAPKVYWTMYNKVILPFVRFHQEQLSQRSVQPLVEEALQLLRDCLEQGTTAVMCIELLHCLGTSCSELLTNHVADILYMFLDLEYFDEMYCIQVKVFPLDQHSVICRLPDMFSKLSYIPRKSRQTVLAFLEVIAQHQSQVFNHDHISTLLEMYPTQTEEAQRSILHILSLVSLEFPDRVLRHYSALTNDSKFTPASLTDRADILARVSHNNEEYSKTTIDYMMKHVVSKDPAVALVAMETLGPLLKTRPQTLSKVKVKLKALAKSSASSEFREICQDLIPEIAIKGNKTDVKESKSASTEVKKPLVQAVTKTPSSTTTKQPQSRQSLKSQNTSDKLQPQKKPASNILPSKPVVKTVKPKQPAVIQNDVKHLEQPRPVTLTTPSVTSSLAVNVQKATSDVPASSVEVYLKSSQQGKQPMQEVQRDTEKMEATLCDKEEELQETVSGAVVPPSELILKKEPEPDTVLGIMKLPSVIDSDASLTKTSANKATEETTVVDSNTGEDQQKLPRWITCFCQMMNPKSDNDWMKLSSHLGYSADAVRDLTNQNDPSLSLLKDYYQSHGTRRASQMLLDALEKMKRFDISPVIENTLKSSDCLASDQDFEYESPPPIFLSCHWNDQKEARLLCQHLRLAGYQCWMDNGQMGSGDDLLLKIENGISGSRVLVSLVTQKYTQSINCTGEVNLTTTHNIPVIPLLLENTEWPPEGQLEPVFKDKLYIRFYQRAGEKSGDQRFWPSHKFQELLMQLNYLKILPIQSLISPEYANWWLHLSDDQEVKENKTDITTPADTFPSIFISYQWGKQPYVKSLYKQLMVLGFSCWMDIYRQSSSESLYNSIAQGIQACRVVLACVTHKYTLESRCQQELRQASSLNRPIIPILLEKITWPPKGPMESLLSGTQCLQLNQPSDINFDWSSSQFENLVQKLRTFVPMKKDTGSQDLLDEVKDREMTDEKDREMTDEVNGREMTNKEVKQVNQSGIKTVSVPVYKPLEYTVRSLSHDEIIDVKAGEVAFVHRSDTVPASGWNSFGYDVKTSRSKSCVLL